MINTDLNTLFKQNKSNIESLIKEAEKITGCNLKGRSSSERTYFAYERTYLEPEEIEQARKNNELPGQCNNTNIKVAESKKFKSYYTEVKTTKSGFMDAHIENTYESGEKYYHLMTTRNDFLYFYTRFWDKPIATICFTEDRILYIPADVWAKVDKEQYKYFLETMGDKYTGWGSYNESVYTAINRNCRFDNNFNVAEPFISVPRNLTDTLQYETDMYIGRPCFRGYVGHSASYKSGEKANKTLLCISSLMGEEALSENSYAKCAGINQRTVNKSVLEKGFYYNKKRGDIAIDGKYKNIINQMTNTILAVKGAIAKIDAYPILLDFIISKHVDFNKNTVGIRTARRECDLLAAFEEFLGE